VALMLLPAVREPMAALRLPVMLAAVTDALVTADTSLIARSPLVARFAEPEDTLTDTSPLSVKVTLPVEVLLNCPALVVTLTLPPFAVTLLEVAFRVMSPPVFPYTTLFRSVALMLLPAVREPMAALRLPVMLLAV